MNHSNSGSNSRSPSLIQPSQNTNNVNNNINSLKRPIQSDQMSANKNMATNQNLNPNNRVNPQTYQRPPNPATSSTNSAPRPAQSAHSSQMHQNQQKKPPEHQLVNSPNNPNAKISNQKLPSRQPDYINKEKALRITEELRQNKQQQMMKQQQQLQNNGNANATTSNNNSNIYQLKEASNSSLGSKIQNALRRNSFDTDLPQQQTSVPLSHSTGAKGTKKIFLKMNN